MLTLLRRMFWLGLLGGAGYAGWTIWHRQHAATPAAAPEWPPMPPPDAPATDRSDHRPAGDATATGAADDVPDETAEPRARRWVEPVDGACPDGYRIKANDNSGIYHVPGGRSYERTVPDRCYANTDDAEADGYRAAKV